MPKKSKEIQLKLTELPKSVHKLDDQPYVLSLTVYFFTEFF